MQNSHRNQRDAKHHLELALSVAEMKRPASQNSHMFKSIVNTCFHMILFQRSEVPGLVPLGSFRKFVLSLSMCASGTPILYLSDKINLGGVLASPLEKSCFGRCTPNQHVHFSCVVYQMFIHSVFEASRKLV